MVYAGNSSSITGTPPEQPTAGSALAPPGGGGGFDFEFSGEYTWGEVITSLCRDGWCRTQLPRTFFEMKVPLNIYENSFNDAFKALSLQAEADGYILRKKGSKRPFLVIAELDEEKTSSYVSCLDTIVHSVPAKDLYRYKLADSLRCKSRSRSLDSLRALADSVFFPSTRYRVSFYVVSSAFLRTLGVDWTTLWAKGNLVHRPDLITDWALKAVSENDSTAEFRSLEVDLDSTATLHWGSQKKDQKSTVVYANGVSQNDYEWRNYGLTLTLSRDIKGGLRADYQLAQRDEANSVLRGNFGGGGVDSISAIGVYDSYQNVVSGIPVLSEIPLIGRLFSTENREKIKSFFVIEISRVVEDGGDYLNFPAQDTLRVNDVQYYQDEEE